MDDNTAWPQVLMELLKRSVDVQNVWIANAGMDGLNTAHHLNFLQTIPSLRRADMLVFLIGVNDLMTALAFEGQSCDSQMRYGAGRLFADGNTWPLYRRLKVYSLFNKGLSRMFSRVTSHDVRDCEGADSLARLRTRGPFVSLPDLSVPLGEFRGRIIELGYECKSTGKRCVFLTQPTIWSNALTIEEESRLWFGWIGMREAPRGYIRTMELAEAMKRYNATLLSTCAAQRLECYNLADAIPRSQQYFYDDCHFTESGARIVASYLAKHIKFKK